MIRVFHWQNGQPIPHNEDFLPGTVQDLPEGTTLWLDMAEATPDEETRFLGQFLTVHPLTLEDVTRPRREPESGAHMPKVEEFEKYLLVIANPLPKAMTNPDQAQPQRWKAKDRPQLTAILTDKVLITHHYQPLNCIVTAQKHVERHITCGNHGPDYLLHLVLDAMVDEYAPVLEKITDKLDTYERLTFIDPTQKMLTRLLRLKRKISFLRKTLVLEREVLARLIRGEFALVEDREIAYYRNVYDHLARYAELVETGREMVGDLMQSHLAAVSNRLNEVMKTLTMISTIVLPMTLVAGVYGMNFENMPEIKWEWGYPLAMGLMFCMGLTSFVYFRWKKWV